MRKKNGYILIATGAGAIVLIGMLGMAVDLGRLYITKNEAQTFTDTAALRAVIKLNGKSTGITSAQNAVATAAANGWNMGTQAFQNTEYTVDFSTAATGAAWVSNPNPATNYGFVRVQATPSLPLTFIRMVGAPATQQVRATSVAGLVLATFPLGGYMPFTPFAQDAADPNFGFTIGQEYAFLWSGNVKQKDACSGNGWSNTMWDTWNMSDIVGGSDRGYFELQSASSIADAILAGKQTMALAVGDLLNLTGGQKNAEQSALNSRSSYDTDRTDYSALMAASCRQSNNNCTAPAYHGNGQRLVIMPVNSYDAATGQARVIGFSSFLLATSYGNQGNQPWCAIYMGAGAVGSTDVTPYTTGGAFVARLVQ